MRRAVPSSSVVDVVTARNNDFVGVGLRREMVPGHTSRSRVEKNASGAALSKH
jgi:hypothetical protein